MLGGCRNVKHINEPHMFSMFSKWPTLELSKHCFLSNKKIYFSFGFTWISLIKTVLEHEKGGSLIHEPQT